MIDGSLITDVKTLRIENIGKLVGKINGIGCGSKCEILLKKEQLKEAKINAVVDDFLFDLGIKILDFKIASKNQKTIKVKENIITNEAFNKLIMTLNVGDIIQIFDIRVSCKCSLRMKAPSPIIIRIIE